MDTNTHQYTLIAEDDQFYANIYKVKLAKEGYETMVVGNGEWVMRAVKEKKPDLILLDLVMPVKDGFETLQELKANPEFKDIKILVLTNLGQEEDAIKAKELGAENYLIKTNISIEDVLVEIKQILA